jgi:hypothetical protein
MQKWLAGKRVDRKGTMICVEDVVVTEEDLLKSTFYILYSIFYPR